MLFTEEDAPFLKKWIVNRLENTSDVDADVLADYVLALLRHDGDEHTVRQLCEAEIPDFLKEDSAIFVRDVFDAIHYKSYIPGHIPPRRPSAPFAPPTGPSMQGYGNLGGMGGMGPPMGAPVGPQNGLRKRPYNDRDMEGQFQGGDPNVRSYKQVRRGGPSTGRGNFDNFGPGADRGGRQAPMSLQNLPQFPGMPGLPNSGMDTNMLMGMPSPPPGMPGLDPNNPLAAILAMQAMGIPVPNLPGLPQLSSPTMPSYSRPKRPRCIDYDQKGFCAKGNTCQFEHGEHSIWVPPAKRQEEYDPMNSGLLSGPSNGRGGFNRGGGDRGRGRGGPNNGGQFSSPARRGGRSEFSSDRPNYDKTNTTIVVENIPEEKFIDAEVRAFFNEFGNIVEVEMKPYKRLAVIKYDDWDSAKAAYNSPKVIFDNRFVKVYWYVGPESLPQPPLTSANGFPINGSASDTPAPEKPVEPEINIEEFRIKQEEVQKAHEEKIKKAQEIETTKKDIEKRQEELLKRSEEEKRKLFEKMAARNAALSSVKKENGESAPATGEKLSTDFLKAKLAALEAEAETLGIQPNFDEEQPWAGRGRGRGRGGYRGRAAYVPRGRGGYKGRGGAPFAPAGRSFNLDNRPKKIRLTGVDFTNPMQDESLREFLLGIGEFTDIEVTPSHTSITFKERFTAEKFMATGGELPSIGRVEMSWMVTPLPPITAAPARPATAIKHENGHTDEDIQMEEGDAMVTTASSTNHRAVEQTHHHAGGDQQENFDYDVADDNDWGPE